MEYIDSLSGEFEIMCYVRDERAARGSCTLDGACNKFGKLPVMGLLEQGMLSQTTYGMLNWTKLGEAAMSTGAVARRITKQVLREKGIIE